MKKYILKCVLSFLLIIIMFFSYEKISEATTSSGGYTITSYHVDMIVNENNTFDITETITANFTDYGKHGIYRKIPLHNKITRTDGTTSNNRAKITNINVSENYTKSMEGGNLILKIGDASKTVSGSHTYTIKYNYNIGKDTLKKADELYFNIIGTEWDTSISGINFNITMPKEFDDSSLGFSTGNYGSTGSSNVAYKVYGNLISGSVTNTLSAYNGLTIRLTLPEGYFVNASNNFNVYVILGIMTSVIFVIISFNIWRKYGKDDVSIETIEFNPPEGLNSAEVGYAYKGKTEDKDIISLLIYLANKGYLKIEETEEQRVFATHKSFKIIKLKDYDGNNEIERRFFNGLFLCGERDHVFESSLTGKFYTTIEDIRKDLESTENRDKYFEKSSLTKAIYIALMMVVEFVIINIVPFIDQANLTIYMVIIGAAILFSIFTILIAIQKGNAIKYVVSSFISIMIIVLPFFGIIIETIISDINYTVTFIVGIIAIIIMMIILVLMPKRNEKGTELLGRIKGFKRFLETAEKEQLEAQVLQNPKYFYEILPYTYVFNISDKWIKQFESISIQPPDWYNSNDFNVYTFGIFMSSTMTKAVDSMTYYPESNGSGMGGFSGGGFSRRRLWWRPEEALGKR